MSDLIETSEFTAGIYQIETNDDVLGGENGSANAQAKALANRTKWLKNQLNLKALKNGSAANLFKVKDAISDDDAVNKKQLDDAVANVGLPIGYPMLSYEAYNFTVVAFGGEFNRADYPKLWAWIEAYPEFLLSEAYWQIKNNTDGMCAYYSSGDGVNTFRVPNLNEAFFRASNRGVGTYQADEFKEHTHSYEMGNRSSQYDSNNMEDGNKGTILATTGSTGGSETRPENIALLPLIVAT